MNLKNIRQTHVDWLTSENTLQQQVGLSLQERAAQFMQRFPDIKLSRYMITKLYKMNKIKKKKIKITKNTNPALRKRITIQAKEVLEQLEQLEHNNYNIIYVDETLFKRNSIDLLQYNIQKKSFQIPQNKVDQKCHALILGISSKNGIDYHEIYEKSVNIEKFACYLNNLRRIHKKQKIAIYLDNLSVHRSKKTQALMQELGIKYVWGIPYSPQYMPIESVFSIVKKNYQKSQIWHIINNKPFILRKLIVSTFVDIEKQKVLNCIRKARQELILKVQVDKN